MKVFGGLMAVLGVLAEKNRERKGRWRLQVFRVESEGVKWKRRVKKANFSDRLAIARRES